MWRYTHANFDLACELLDSTDWDLLFCSGDVNECWSNWKSRFLQVMELCVPQSTLRSRRNLPWLTKTIVQAIRRRNSLFRVAKRSKSSASYQKYRAARNRVVALLRLSKAKYFNNLRSLDAKEFWKAIKLLSKQESSIPTLINNGTPVEDNRGKAVLLNEFFHSCFNNHTPPLTPQPSLLAPCNCPQDLLCSEDEIFHLISTLRPI